jgi:hypothetical protein
VNDILDGFVGFVIGGFEFAVRPVCRIWFVMEAAVGEGTTEAFVKEQEQQGDVNTFGRQAIGIASAISLKQTLPFEFAQIVSELVESVRFR